MAGNGYLIPLHINETFGGYFFFFFKFFFLSSTQKFIGILVIYTAIFNLNKISEKEIKEVVSKNIQFKTYPLQNITPNCQLWSLQFLVREP